MKAKEVQYKMKGNDRRLIREIINAASALTAEQIDDYLELMNAICTRIETKTLSYEDFIQELKRYPHEVVAAMTTILPALASLSDDGHKTLEWLLAECEE